MIVANRFYIANEGPPKQGDILFAAVARLVGEDRYVPAAWRNLDVFDAIVEPGDGGSQLRLVTGPALVMVTSHDCHFDKEWSRRRSALMEQGVEDGEATRRADEDPGLDRTFTASPLIRPDEIDRDQNTLMAGKVIGYLPVPASPDGLVPEAVVDLTYRVTLDRLDIVRVACVSVEARAQLRYALAHLESLRAPTIAFELEAVVGRQIQRITFPRKHPLFVRLHLDDGTTIDLLQHPGEPDDGPARAAPSGPAA